MFLWCSPGRVEIDGVADGGESILRVLVRGEFTGEITLLSGRRSLVRCRAQESSEVLEIGRQNLRRIMQTDAELGETFLRAFLLRRVYLIAHSVGEAVLVTISRAAATTAHELRAETLRARDDCRVQQRWSAFPRAACALRQNSRIHHEGRNC